MMIERLDGQTQMWESSSWPRGLLLCIDVTFPYAQGGGCPAEVMSHDAFDPDCLARLNDRVGKAVHLHYTTDPPAPGAAALAPRLARLIEQVTESSHLEGDELLRDEYADLDCFCDYIAELVRLSPTYSGVTHGEDAVVPGSTSSYDLHWDARPTKAAAVIAGAVANDIERLDALCRE